jgi:hypothetical protein
MSGSERMVRYSYLSREQNIRYLPDMRIEFDDGMLLF